jgi:hypothetical protein
MRADPSPPAFGRLHCTIDPLGAVWGSTAKQRALAQMFEMTSSIGRSAHLPWLLAALLVGCGSHTRAGAVDTSRVPAKADNDEWSRATWEERHDVMTFAVLPNMARSFQRFRGASVPDLTCRSCHGLDAEAVAFKMPHGLSALDPQHLPVPGSASPRARMAQFMFDVVVPEMTELIGVEGYDRRTGRGFGCFNCHPGKAG